MPVGTRFSTPNWARSATCARKWAGAVSKSVYWFGGRIAIGAGVALGRAIADPAVPSAPKKTSVSAVGLGEAGGVGETLGEIEGTGDAWLRLVDAG